ncbi:MAG: trypsin-like peptidase domain-containing protein [Gemmatimonadetes bacterium]|nr:trypsin-like peptidase domain-containing protein [Gemmatimonadota bacterium]
MLSLALLPAARAAAQDVVSITRRASPAVITLHTYNAAGRETGLGSGFFLADGRVATNRHVVEGASRIEAMTSDDRHLGSATYAEAIGGPTADLAVLPRFTQPPATLPLAGSMPEVGEAIVVIGAPEGLSNTVSTGIVSAIRNVDGKTLIQISAPISHGSSGGPVLNMRGEVIGVSVAVLSEGQNLNFAVPVTELQRVTRQTPGRIAFNGDLRFGGSDRGTARGRDVNSLSLSSLPRISLGQSVSGRLTTSDFRRPDGSYADAYVYQGRAGEQITATLTSNDFDAWLVITDPSGAVTEYDDDSAGDLNSQLSITLPRSGPYLIVANSVADGATGAYTLSLRSGGGGGNGGRVTPPPSGNGGNSAADLDRVDVSRLERIAAGQTVSGRITSGDMLLSDGTYAHPYVYYGRAGERITATLRSGAFDSWLVIHEPNGELHEYDDDSGGGNDSQLTVTLPRTGRYLIVANTVGQRDTGPFTLSVTSGGGMAGGNDNGGIVSQGQPSGTMAITDLNWRQLPVIRSGQTVTGRLTGSLVRSDDNTYMNAFVYQGRSGEHVTITLRSSDVDAWLVVNDPNGPLYEHDDDSAGGNDSQLDLTLPHDGPYVIVANEVSRGSGSYSLTVSSGGNDRVIRRIP